MSVIDTLRNSLSFVLDPLNAFRKETALLDQILLGEKQMTKVFDLYGILSVDIDTAARLLGEALQVSFEPHESSFWGDYYLVHNDDWTEEFSFNENFNEMEDDWNYSQFQEYPLTLELKFRSVARAHELEERLTKISDVKIVLLERNEYPTKEG